MRGVSLEVLVAGVGVLVGLAGVVVAILQSRAARADARAAERAAIASQEQAESARRSADASLTQAQAAVEQVELLRRQAEAERLDRDERDAPVFLVDVLAEKVLGVLRSSGGEQRFVPVLKRPSSPTEDWVEKRSLKIQLVQGPPEIVVNVTAITEEKESVAISANGPFQMVENSSITIDVFTQRASEVGTLEVLLRSTEVGGLGRDWKRRRSVRL